MNNQATHFRKLTAAALIAAALVMTLVAPVPAAPADGPSIPVDSPVGQAGSRTAAESLPEDHFPDVGVGHPFHEPITWAVEAGIVSGYPDGTFGPTRPLSRQALASILWDLAGNPDAGTPDFTDVPADHEFAGAIAWLADSGLSVGYDDGTFRPDVPASRQAVAALLHRYVTVVVEPTVRDEPTGFTDVGEDHPFHEAITWLVETGAASGYEDGTFRPTVATSRQALVAFVHGLVANGDLPDPTVPAPEIFDGPVADFYIVPEPLAPAPPGTLIRLQVVDLDRPGFVTLRIMYHSRDAMGRDRAVTGTMTYPTGEAPEGGWPVVSVANGTVGLGGQCALSRHRSFLGSYGIQAVTVASDYIGMGPVGEIQAYLSRASEAHSVIDAVRAARNHRDADAGDRWLTVGGSQGGHGALVAGELAATYAPELELLGVVAHAPAAMFGYNYNALDVVVTRVVTLMAMFGAATETDDIDPADYLHPEALAAVVPVVQTGCTNEIAIAVGPWLSGADFWITDPYQHDVFKAHMEENDAGLVDNGVPLLVLQGTDDVTVFPERTDDLVERLCGIGQTTHYVKLPGRDHGWWGPEGDTLVREFFEARLAGEPATDTCP